MVGDRLARALARIEAAAGRIEAAACVPSPASDDTELQRKYDVLRREARQAMAELDGLIGTLER